MWKLVQIASATLVLKRTFSSKLSVERNSTGKAEGKNLSWNTFRGRTKAKCMGEAECAITSHRLPSSFSEAV